MNNKIRQHVPGFADVSPQEAEFDTLEGLYEIPFVKKRMHGVDFDCFSLNSDALISVEEKGAYWWVVGYIEHPELVDIPKIAFDDAQNKYVVPQ